MILDQLGTSTLRLAKVTFAHPEGQCVDVIFLDSGDYGRDVMVMSPYAGTDFGFTGGIPRPEEEGHDPNARTEPDKRHIIAVVAMVNGRYVALGFLFPQVAHMAFNKDADPDRMIERHPSDHYRTIDTHANFEQYHPGDAWLRIAEGTDHHDLTGRDFDKRWKLKHNGDTTPVITLWNRKDNGHYADLRIEKETITIEVVGNSHSRIVMTSDSIDIDTTGDIDAHAGGDITIRSDGGISMTASSDITIQSGSHVQVTAPQIDLN